MRLIFSIIADCVTLGGMVNDGWWRNGHRSYTHKELDRLGITKWWKS